MFVRRILFSVRFFRFNFILLDLNIDEKTLTGRLRKLPIIQLQPILFSFAFVTVKYK